MYYSCTGLGNQNRPEKGATEKEPRTLGPFREAEKKPRRPRGPLTGVSRLFLAPLAAGDRSLQLPDQCRPACTRSELAAA